MVRPNPPYMSNDTANMSITADHPFMITVLPAGWHTVSQSSIIFKFLNMKMNSLYSNDYNFFMKTELESVA